MSKKVEKVFFIANKPHLKEGVSFPMMKMSIVTHSIIQQRFRNFIKKFNSRNEIDQVEINVLQNAYKDTKVKDIPVSWILSTDYLLENLYRKYRKPAIVLQNSGFFVIQFPNMEPPTPKELNLIKNFEDEVYAINDDLYQELKV